jgi:hypothetical protein
MGEQETLEIEGAEPGPPGSAAERFVALRDLLQRAFDLDEAARRGLVAEVAREDPELAGELAELIDADAAASVLDRGLQGLVAELAAVDEGVATAAVPPSLPAAEASSTARHHPRRRWLYLPLLLATLGAVAIAATTWSGRAPEPDAVPPSPLAEAARLGRLAATAGEQGRWEQARAHGARRVALLAAWTGRAEEPARAAALAAALRDLAVTASRGGDAASAIVLARRAVAIEDPLYAAWPGDERRMRLAESLLLLGAQLGATARHEEAREALSHAARLLGLGDSPRAPAELARLQWQVAAELALAEVALGRLEAGLIRQQEAILWIERLLGSSPASARVALDALDEYRNLADLHVRAAEGASDAAARRHHLALARDGYRRAAEVSRAHLDSPEAGDDDRFVHAALARSIVAVERRLRRELEAEG